MRRRSFILAPLAFLSLLALPGIPESQAETAKPKSKKHKKAQYRLGPGDELRVTVFGQKDLSGEFTVDGSGMIAFPLVGNIEAGGKTLRQFENALTDALKPNYLKNPRVSVEVLNYRPFYIIGEVKNPGSYPYVNGMTVVNAIALAGGYTYRADHDDVKITRATNPSRKPIHANKDTAVLPGDVIDVPERFF